MRRHFSNDEIEISHLKGSGPGGQNRNKRMTGVRIKHLPTGTVVLSTERRSQLQNLQNALERLDDKLAALFHRDKPRKKTKIPYGSTVKRLGTKKHRGDRKRIRQKIGGFDGE